MHPFLNSCPGLLVYAEGMNAPASSPVPTAAIVARFFVSFGLMGACFFATAGTLAWVEAWAYLAVQFASSLTMTAWMVRHDPALLESRMTFFKHDMQPRDRLFMGVFVLLFIPFLLLPGLDAVRYGWSEVPIWLEAVGLAGVAGSMLLILKVMQVNSFASPTIEVQKERGHRVIDTGPYALVRHPMYSGFTFYMACVSLALGSWWTLLVGVLIAVLFLLRIPMEEQTLRTELDGYADYCNRVHFRLIPGVW